MIIFFSQGCCGFLQTDSELKFRKREVHGFLSHSKWRFVVNSLLLRFHKLTLWFKVAHEVCSSYKKQQIVLGRIGWSQFCLRRDRSLVREPGEKSHLLTQSTQAFPPNQSSPSWVTNRGTVGEDFFFFNWASSVTHHRLKIISWIPTVGVWGGQSGAEEWIYTYFKRWQSLLKKIMSWNRGHSAFLKEWHSFGTQGVWSCLLYSWEYWSAPKGASAWIPRGVSAERSLRMRSDTQGAEKQEAGGPDTSLW